MECGDLRSFCERSVECGDLRSVKICGVWRSEECGDLWRVKI